MSKKKQPPLTWAEAVVKARTKRGLTQVKAAELLGIAAITWIFWENNKRTPSSTAKQLLRLTFPEADFPE